jgi:hypothetical protein
MSSRYLTRRLLLCLGLGMPLVAGAQTFVFGDFSGSNVSSLKLNGSAAIVSDGASKVLRLTPALDSQAGSAFNLNPISLGANASFSTAFSFRMTNGGGIDDPGAPNPETPGADGIVFALNTVTNTVGTAGYGVGFENLQLHSVGIKYDTWGDLAGSFPQANDPNGNFVAIYTNGSVNTTGLDTYSPAADMNNGAIWYSWIDYNGATDLLEMRLSLTNVRPDDAQLVRTLNLEDPSLLGASPQIYAGFTSGTGGARNNHDILSWQFETTYKPIETVGNSVPDSGNTIALLGGVLVLMAMVRRSSSGRS